MVVILLAAKSHYICSIRKLLSDVEGEALTTNIHSYHEYTEPEYQKKFQPLDHSFNITVYLP
jgi:hypothetical protein